MWGLFGCVFLSSVITLVFFSLFFFSCLSCITLFFLYLQYNLKYCLKGLFTQTNQPTALEVCTCKCFCTKWQRKPKLYIPYFFCYKTIFFSSRGQFHKTIYDVFSSQKDRTMFLNQNLRFIKIKKFTKFSLSGVNLRS